MEWRGPFWSAPVPSPDEVVRRTPFPLYGLAPDWTGPRWVRGCGVSAGELVHVSLGHGAPDTGVGPALVVETLLGVEGEPWWAPYRAALHLGDAPAAPFAPSIVADRHVGRWRPWSVAVDGRHQVFWFHEVGERWAAFARVGPVRVVVAATRWDRAEVGLTAVDRAAYLDPAGTAGSGSTTSR